MYITCVLMLILHPTAGLVNVAAYRSNGESSLQMTPW